MHVTWPSASYWHRIPIIQGSINSPWRVDCCFCCGTTYSINKSTCLFRSSQEANVKIRIYSFFRLETNQLCSTIALVAANPDNALGRAHESSRCVRLLCTRPIDHCCNYSLLRYYLNYYSYHCHFYGAPSDSHSSARYTSGHPQQEVRIKNKRPKHWSIARTPVDMDLMMASPGFSFSHSFTVASWIHTQLGTTNSTVS